MDMLAVIAIVLFVGVGIGAFVVLPIGYALGVAVVCGIAVGATMTWASGRSFESGI